MVERRPEGAQVAAIADRLVITERPVQA